MSLTQANAAQFADLFNKMVLNVGQALLGKEQVIRLAVTTMLAEGHLLLEDAPALVKPPWPAPWRPLSKVPTRVSSSPLTCYPATSPG